MRVGLSLHVKTLFLSIKLRSDYKVKRELIKSDSVHFVTKSRLYADDTAFYLSAHQSFKKYQVTLNVLCACQTSRG